MPTIRYTRTGPGSGSVGTPVRAAADRPMRIETGEFDFDNSYPTGGESIADIFARFKQLHGILFSGRGDRLFQVDYTNQRVLMYTAVGTQAADLSNQSAITGVRWIAWGY